MKSKLLLVFGFVSVLGALAIFNAALVSGSHTSISGWLWSGTSDNALPGCVSPRAGTTACGGAGWVNLNHTNPSPYTPGSINYGISIPATDGPVTGSAWSSNLGWIDFAPGGTPPSGASCGAPCPSAPGVERSGNDLAGWARVVSIANAGSNAGGWAGWIKLAGPGYGVTIDPLTGAITGYGWSNELGWINFNASLVPPPSTYTLTVAITGGGNGTVNINPPNSNCTNATAPCTQTYPSTPATTVTLTASAAAGSSFVGWSGDCTGAGAVCTVSMAGNRSVTATFVVGPPPPPPPPTCTLTASPSSGSSPLSGTLTWTTTNAPTSCTASGGWSGSKDPAGDSQSFGPIFASATYNLNCSNSIGSGLCSTTASVIGPPPPPPLGPDLTVDSLATSPAAPSVGNIVTFSGTVRNIGTVNVDTTETWFSLNGGPPSTNFTSNLDPGEFENESWTISSWPATAGNHQFEICADGLDEVTELNESNNCATLTFTVTPTGGGGPLSCSGSPGPAYLSAGGAVTWTATGGTAPYSWTFSCPSSPSCPASTSGNPVTVTYTTTGDKFATVSSGSNPPYTCHIDVKRIRWFEIIPGL